VIGFLDLKVKPQAMLSPEALMQKLDVVLTAAARYIRQIPAAELAKPFRNRNRPIRALAYHVFRIVEGFLESMQDGKELTYERIMRDDAPADMTPEDLARYGESVLARAKAWWAAHPDKTCAQPIPTYFGEHPLHVVLERTVWHPAQHTRQLMLVLESLGIAPDQTAHGRGPRGAPATRIRPGTRTERGALAQRPLGGDGHVAVLSRRPAGLSIRQSEHTSEAWPFERATASPAAMSTPARSRWPYSASMGTGASSRPPGHLHGARAQLDGDRRRRCARALDAHGGVDHAQMPQAASAYRHAMAVLQHERVVAPLEMRRGCPSRHAALSTLAPARRAAGRPLARAPAASGLRARKAASASRNACGASSIGVCPMPSRRRKREPAMRSASSRAVRGGATGSSAPQTTSVGATTRQPRARVLRGDGERGDALGHALEVELALLGILERRGEVHRHALDHAEQPPRERLDALGGQRHAAQERARAARREAARIGQPMQDARHVGHHEPLDVLRVRARVAQRDEPAHRMADEHEGAPDEARGDVPHEGRVARGV
jgi:hypothetical protein